MNWQAIRNDLIENRRDLVRGIIYSSENLFRPKKNEKKTQQLNEA